MERLDMWPGDVVLVIGDKPEDDEVGTMLSTGELEWSKRE